MADYFTPFPDADFTRLDALIEKVSRRLVAEMELVSHARRNSVRLAPLDLESVAALNPRALARFMDHTLLKSEASSADVERLCREALEFGFAAVCINPDHLEACVRMLKGSSVKVATVVGFPLGATTMRIKAYEAEDAVRRGADELDMVLHVGRLKEGHYHHVRSDIQGVVEAAGDTVVKVILETGLLNEDEKIAACLLARAAGGGFCQDEHGADLRRGDRGGCAPDAARRGRRHGGQGGRGDPGRRHGPGNACRRGQPSRHVEFGSDRDGTLAFEIKGAAEGKPAIAPVDKSV